MPNSGKKPKASYLDNLVKEIKQTGTAWQKAWDSSADITPGANERARKARKTFENQKGQLIGAIVGRQYGKGGRRTQ